MKADTATQPFESTGAFKARVLIKSDRWVAFETKPSRVIAAINVFVFVWKNIKIKLIPSRFNYFAVFRVTIPSCLCKYLYWKVFVRCVLIVRDFHINRVVMSFLNMKWIRVDKKFHQRLLNRKGIREILRFWISTKLPIYNDRIEQHNLSRLI